MSLLRSGHALTATAVMDSYDSEEDTDDVDDEHDRIDFSFFTSLLTAISQVSHSKNTIASRSKADHPALNKFRLWVNAFRKRYPNPAKGTTAIVFRLLFPDEDVRRKYDMQEKQLAQALRDALATSNPRLLKWDQDGASGCLGAEVRQVMDQTSTIDPEEPSRLTIDEADMFLDELAAISVYSHDSVRSKYPSAIRRKRNHIIREIYSTLSAVDASFLTQIILKDLRPLLYSSNSRHYADALKNYNSTSIRALTKEDAMKIWDPTKSMLQSYSHAATLEDAAAAFENGVTISAPRLGTPIEIPKSWKGQGCSHALSLLRSAKVVWVETKYDGERAQIHVEVLPSGIPNITIFSKSRRDSTQDRAAIHSIILDTLRLSDVKPHIQIKNIILDAEMVAHNGVRIDEFWRIRKLIENTAVGPRSRRRASVILESQSSLLSDVGNEERHLALVFFDVLYLNSVSLLSSSYRDRRRILESIIKPIPAYAMLSDRIPILMHNPEEAEARFRQIYAESIADYQEGVVLKADDGGYNRAGCPWVKLKRDYIQGLGDTVDLVFLGAGWAKDRSRELDVPTDTFTTFYIGTLKNSEELKHNLNVQPTFLVHFIAEYGLDRDSLEHINFCIKSSEPVSYSLLHKSGQQLPYLFELYQGLHPPSFLLRCPLLVEVMGANFTKSEGCNEYELRFPRILKVYRPAERSWRDGVNRKELCEIARKAVGRDSKYKDIEDEARTIWNLPTSPSARSSERREARIAMYEKKLLDRDRKRKGNAGFDSLPTKRSRKSDTIATVAASSPRVPLRMTTNVVHLESPIVGPPTPQSLESQRTKASPSPLLQLEGDSEAEFLQESLIFFVKHPSCADSLPFAPQWKKLVPYHCRVHALSSLLDGCGWQADSEQRFSPWAKRGVIIIDKSRSAARDWEAYVNESMAKRKMSLPTRKPIWVFDGSLPVTILKGQALYVFS
ncbi:uncharacterized protein BT62DRAFT_325260 [Guyanagaster necrorhizus]|uniref:ATP-dependent DNA ligase family profile domain-containing protein n=1 Tax=Guyanagaster necrorhizus TaxID=856835 RepID=A0A9P7VM16_9AGAR|nr:uncharacterized protein BT62DRAFT_325260 [Guyanagaster necrorhizus MCA 3950]KAG7443683.1 hypothetical protein BT62DRAFT_325260 [Guyanagaster necrorhizus MCA 3950]